jgi:hypothetical protein
MELMTACKQYMTRPDDERYKSLEDMYADALNQRNNSQTIRLPADTVLKIGYDAMEEDMFLEATGEDMWLEAADQVALSLNNWTFGQVCGRVKAPADYLLSLGDPELAAECLNRGLAKRRISDMARQTKGLQLYHCRGTLRAVTSKVYSRIHDCDIIQRLIPLKDQGWKTPPAWGSPNSAGAWQATEEDVCNYSLVQPGDWIKPSGLYRGDRDMFAFMVNDQSRIDDGTDQGLGRGFFVRNSEVGAASFSFMDFLYRYICGNHIVWGAQNVQEVRLRHVGADTPEKAFDALACELIEYANMSVAGDELLIKKAKKFVLGASKEEVLDFLFGKNLMSRKLANDCYETCERFEAQLNPRSAWGIIQGLTRTSQEAGFADKRSKLDSITPKILAFAG